MAEQCTSALTGFPEYYLGPIPVGITEVVETSVPPLYDPAPPVTVDVPQNIENWFTGAGQGGSRPERATGDDGQHVVRQRRR